MFEAICTNRYRGVLEVNFVVGISSRILLGCNETHNLAFLQFDGLLGTEVVITE